MYRYIDIDIDLVDIDDLHLEHVWKKILKTREIFHHEGIGVLPIKKGNVVV